MRAQKNVAGERFERSAQEAVEDILLGMNIGSSSTTLKRNANTAIGTQTRHTRQKNSRVTKSQHKVMLIAFV